MDELIEQYAADLARAYLKNAGDQQMYELAVRMFDRILNLQRQRTEPLLAALQAHFNAHGAASDPELADAFANYCMFP